MADVADGADVVGGSTRPTGPNCHRTGARWHRHRGV